MRGVRRLAVHWMSAAVCAHPRPTGKGRLSSLQGACGLDHGGSAAAQEAAPHRYLHQRALCTAWDSQRHGLFQDKSRSIVGPQRICCDVTGTW